MAGHRFARPWVVLAGRVRRRWDAYGRLEVADEVAWSWFAGAGRSWLVAQFPAPLGGWVAGHRFTRPWVVLAGRVRRRWDAHCRLEVADEVGLVGVAQVCREG
ncbi:hypothetical protein GCM10010350_55420 [Streptomyces galilaeus]|nr:hypothetical protein GCM10010350_55420 [Streptomyces galilaeus]